MEAHGSSKVSEYRRENIVYRPIRPASIVLGVGLLVSVISGGSALAQGVENAKLQLTPSRDSGVSGTAALTDVDGSVRVELNMDGLPEGGVEHINHIHAGGTCADDRAGNTAPVTIPLNTIVAEDDGTGSATTTIEDVTLDELFDKDKERFILFHAKAIEGQGVPPGIACADIVQMSGNDGSEALPASGGISPVMLLLIAVLSTLSAVS
jgi:Cu/Zn superoxide dismutase